MAEYLVSLDGGAAASAGAATSWTAPGALAQGRHSLAVRARDGVGNTGEAATLDFLVDTVPPSPPPELAKASPEKEARPAFTWGPATDAISGVKEYQVRLDGGGWTTVGVEVKWQPGEPLGDGTHQIEVRAADRAGNLSQATSLQFLVDATPPTTPEIPTLTSPLNDLRPALAWGAASDAGMGIAGYEVRLDGGPWAAVGDTLSWKAVQDLGQGRHVFEVRARDKADNSGPGSKLEFVLDASPPRILNMAMTLGAPGEMNISWDTDEPARGRVEYGETAALGQATPWGSQLAAKHSFSLTGLTPGATYHLRLKAVDAAGNEAALEAGNLVLGESPLRASDLRVTPSMALPDEEVSITVRVSNLGQIALPFSLPLLIDGEEAFLAQGRLQPGDVRQLSFSAKYGAPGQHRVEWGKLVAEFAVAAPLTQASLAPALSVGAAATAKDDQGQALPVSPGSLEVRREAGRLSLALPIQAPQGTRVASFEDPSTGASLAGGQLTIPVRGRDGEVAFNIVAQVGAVEGRGSEALAPVTSLALEVPERALDLSAQAPKIGQVAVSIRAELKDLPEAASLRVAVRRELALEAAFQLQEAASRKGKELAGIAYIVEINKENLADEAVVGAAAITMKVGRAWVEEQGVDRVAILRLSDRGEAQALDTAFLGFEGEQAVFQGQSPGGLSLFALASLRPGPVPPARLQTSDLRIDLLKAAPGQAVTISVAVVNVGGMEGSLAVALRLNGELEAERPVTLAPGASERVTFTVRREAGVYQVEVGGLAGSFHVLAPAALPLVLPLPPPSRFPWALAAGALAGLALAAGLLGGWLLLRRRIRPGSA